MGTVKTIAVAPDFSKVLVTVETVREAEPFLTDKTIFWVVKPELFAGNVTGLETLLSGSYIGMRPSTEKGKPRHHFIGEQDPPVLQAWAKGTTFKLQSKRLGSISLGSPIFSAISTSAPCWAGTSAIWPATSPSTPSCARPTTSTCTTTRRSGTPPACR